MMYSRIIETLGFMDAHGTAFVAEIDGNLEATWAMRSQ